VKKKTNDLVKKFLKKRLRLPKKFRRKKEKFPTLMVVIFLLRIVKKKTDDLVKKFLWWQRLTGETKKLFWSA